MALTSNPSRTRQIERRWLTDVARRWRAYRTSVLGAITRPGIAWQANAADPFVLSAEQQRTYMAFVEGEIERLLLETERPPNWQARYQLDSYERGLVQVRAQLIAQGASITPTEAERLAAEGLEAFTATPSLATSAAPGQQVHADALEFLYTRSYTSLKGWTDRLAVETRQILFTGVEAGEGVEEIRRRMSERIDVSESRARTIAQTETNQAYSRSSLNEIKRASDETGETVGVRWITARDSRVRHAHAQLHGVVMTPERALGVKNTDGINCRCAMAPVVPGTDTAKRRKRFEAEREALLLFERK